MEQKHDSENFKEEERANYLSTMSICDVRKSKNKQQKIYFKKEINYIFWP